MAQLDRTRAAGVQPITASTVTAGDEPLIVDIQLPASPGEHYIVEGASLNANLITRQPNTAGGFPPLSGIFLCPPGTPTELLTEAQAGWNMNARPVMVPLGPPGANVGAIGAGPPYAFALTMVPGFKMTVPYNWFIRAIVTCAQGTATPGPGAGSRGVFTVMAYKERDADPVVC
jgi:hypothetical protein